MRPPSSRGARVVDDDRVIGLLAATTVTRAAAQSTLPYSTRTLSFSGLGTTVHGDLRTVGMGGASAGLADTFAAALDNPAGLAMTVGIGDIHFATDSIADGNIQTRRHADYDEELRPGAEPVPMGGQRRLPLALSRRRELRLEPLFEPGAPHRRHARARRVGGARCSRTSACRSA